MGETQTRRRTAGTATPKRRNAATIAATTTTTGKRAAGGGNGAAAAATASPTAKAAVATMLRKLGNAGMLSPAYSQAGDQEGRRIRNDLATAVEKALHPRAAPRARSGTK